MAWTDIYVLPRTLRGTECDDTSRRAVASKRRYYVVGRDATDSGCGALYRRSALRSSPRSRLRQYDVLLLHAVAARPYGRTIAARPHWGAPRTTALANVASLDLGDGVAGEVGVVGRRSLVFALCWQVVDEVVPASL